MRFRAVLIKICFTDATVRFMMWQVRFLNGHLNMYKLYLWFKSTCSLCLRMRDWKLKVRCFSYKLLYYTQLLDELCPLFILCLPCSVFLFINSAKYKLSLIGATKVSDVSIVTINSPSAAKGTKATLIKCVDRTAICQASESSVVPVTLFVRGA